VKAERLAGAATRAGTRRGCEVFAAGSRQLGRTGYTISPVGFGGYRVRDDMPMHRRALADALRSGINLVDTSTNYGDGRSEALVGRVLAQLVQAGEVRRERVVLVSKIGYAQGSTRKRLAQTQIPEIVRVREDLWHCIHPEFIAAQLDASLQRLGVERLDVLLLHNPEYFLVDALANGEDRAAVRSQYRARLRQAFVALEGHVAAGRIGWYGVSSNGFVVDPEAPSFTSVVDVLAEAQAAGGDEHHLAVVQMPMNLLELGAIAERVPTDDGPRSPLQIAEAADLGVIVNRPLNALVTRDGRQQLLRLADVDGADPVDVDASDRLAVVRKLEAQWATGLGSQLRTEDGDDAVDLFRWGQELTARLDQLEGLEQWHRLRHNVIAPHIGRTSAGLLSSLPAAERTEFAAWWEQYGTALHAVFEAIEARLSARRSAVVVDLRARIDPHLPEPWRPLPLSRKAVLALLGAPIGCVLVGMRQPKYVYDMLALREHPVRLLSAAAGAVDLRSIAADLAHS
jgi:hypothetical protein